MISKNNQYYVGDNIIIPIEALFLFKLKKKRVFYIVHLNLKHLNHNWRHGIVPLWHSIVMAHKIKFNV